MERKPLTEAQALERAEKLCAKAEYCSYDITTRLARWGLDPAAAGRVVACLRRDRFVDDARFAEAFARDKAMCSFWGRAKIKSALAAKRIAPETAAQAVAAIDVHDYQRMVVQQMQQRARGLDMDERGDRDKMLRFAAQRGYGAALALKIIDALAKRGE